MDPIALLIVGGSILAYGALSGRAEKSVVSPPMAFVLVGVLCGPLVFGFIDGATEFSAVHLLAEITLTIVLFTDASRISLKRLRREHDLPVRLLAIGLPLTIVLGTVAASLLFDALTMWECAILAVILAPTDAALGMAVVSDERVPVRIRETLSVESGLNDGVVFPVFLIFLSFAGAGGEGEGAGFWTRFVALQLVLGPLVGIGIGYFGGRLVEITARSGWMNEAFQQLAGIGLAVSAFAGAELVGGNGFLAAFTAGLTLGNTSRSACRRLWEFGETEGQLLTLLVFLALGAVLIPELLPAVGWTSALYAISSLTVIRMIPTALSLIGTGVRPATTAFVGWFGPRGVASVVFVLLLIEHPEVAGAPRIAAIVSLTVLLSIFLHGISARPGAAWYARQSDAMDRDSGPEHVAVTPMSDRISASR